MSCTECNKNLEDCGCGSNGIHVSPPSECNTPTCPDPEICPKIIPTTCIQHVGEDKLCGTDTVYSQGDSIEEVNSKIVDYFCGNSIKIPTPILSLFPITSPTTSQFYPDLAIHFLPFSDTNWLNFNPRIFLFQFKNGKSSHAFEKDIRYYKTGFHHPSHQNGVNFPNGKYYSGATDIPYDTEFPLANIVPYKKFIVGFNPMQFFYAFTPVGIKIKPLTDADFAPGNQLLQGLKVVGRNGSSGRHGYSLNAAGSPRSSYFKLAVAIDNPDTNSEFPVLFSEMTETFQATIKQRQADITAINIQIVTNGIRRLITKIA